MSITQRGITLVAVSCAFVLAACGSDEEGSDPGSDPPAASAALPQGAEPAEIDPDQFTTEIDNPYLPLAVGNRWVYRETEDGEPDQKVVVEVTDKTRTIANGVEARVVRDTVTQGGDLVELTDDWFAQDAAGNVWYLGEDTAEYENGKKVCRCGAWEAGVDSAEPGVIMPADPVIGMEYRQEYLEGEAEDNGAVLSLTEKAQVPFGYFAETLMTRDTAAIEPKVSEHKFFAKDVGMVLAIKHSGGEGREELISFEPGR